jgi:endonuclease-3 related protein
MSILRQIFETLHEYYATKPDYPWWSDNPIEAILSAILVQGSTWKSVDKVLDEFRMQELHDFNKIVQQTEEQLVNLIRPVGFQTKKAARILAVAQLILEQSDGDLDCFFARDVDIIRRELLSISGIGHSTADNILLHAGQVPIYMVDTFTMRVLMRHGIVNSYANETQIQELVHRELTPDEEPYGAKLFQKMQEYLIRLSRDFCDKSRPDCFHCPLHLYLPDGGALGVSVKSVPNASQSKRPPAVPPKPPAQKVKPEDMPDLNDTERQIIAAISEEPIPIDDVVAAVKLPVHIVRATIAVLQIKKLACQVEGNRVRRM